ncbi:MAG: 4'-phosphopantetheinyl transferase superfamily protein [bacterium]|nr:4'-phosphopantetheinyl transferase superfamily protein [bacterium]
MHATTSMLDQFLPADGPFTRPGPREVHLWSADLHPPAWQVERLYPLLSPDEVDRAERFRFPQHRRRSIVRRGLLRLLIGSYLDLDPAGVRFSYGQREKPSVAEGLDGATCAAERFHFNLSDSEDLALYGFAFGRELGVDVEMLRTISDAESISENFFSSQECAVLLEVPAERRSEAFLNCWTRKEAYIKAIGEGLAEPLDRFSLTLRPGEPARFLHFDDQPEEVAAWALFHLVPAPGAVGAVALRGRDWKLSSRSRRIPCYVAGDGASP